MDYLCIDGYTKLVYNFDEFLDRIKFWIDENNYTRLQAAIKLGVSSSLFRFWFNEGTISISTYDKIKNNLKETKLIDQ